MLQSKAVQKTEIFEIEQIVAAVQQGRIRIPHFQRPFRWQREDSLRLFDSILKGYPLGNLLFWERPAHAEKVQIGELEIIAPALDNAWWVIDGQQRITVLANCLNRNRTNPAFLLCLNVESELITFEGEDPGNEVPLWVIVSIPETFKWVQEHPEHMSKTEMFNDVANTIRRFPLPVSIVHEGDESVLREIFDRLNNFGRRLTRSEVFEALHRSEGDDTLNAARVSEQIDAETNFGILDGSTILKCILVLRGPEVSRDFHNEFKDLNQLEIEDAYRNAKEALLKSIEFLQDYAGMPHRNLLPYQYLLVVLCRFFGCVSIPPEEKKETYRKLSRWFWRAALKGPDSGSNTATERNLVRRVQPGSLKDSLHQLLEMPFEYKVVDTHSLRLNTSQAKLSVCAYWQHGPRSFNTSETLRIADLVLAGADSATPTAFMHKIMPPSKLPKMFSTDLASWVFDTSIESLNLLTADEVVIQDEELLESHFFRAEWFSSWNPVEASQVEELLRKRSEWMEAEINSTLKQLSDSSSDGRGWVDTADLEF